MIEMILNTALSEVPVNVAPLISDTDFKTVDEEITFDESGMTLFWHFTTKAGATTVTAVTPTTGGDYDWAHQDHGMYTIEMPATGGASANNDVEGYGWFTGNADGVVPWVGPSIWLRTEENSCATQAQVSNIGSGGSGSFAFAMTDDNVDGALTYGGVFVGTQSNGTFLTTQNDPDTYHEIARSGGDDINLVYFTNVGGNRQAINVLFQGYFSKADKEAVFQVYDFVGADWETIYTLPGTDGAVNTVEPPMRLQSKHTGTGAEIGDVYLRVVVTNQDDGSLFVGTFYAEAVNLAQTVGYANGAIWVDTNNGTAGTENFVNGVADNPVLTWADALTLSASLGIPRFQIINGSTILLSAATDNHTLTGDAWMLQLGGRSIDGAHFAGSSGVTGIATNGSVEPEFHSCCIGAVSMPPCHLKKCGIGKDGGTFTAQAAGQFVFDECYSEVPGSGDVDFVFSGLGSATGINNRGFKGGTSWTVDSDCTVSHEVVVGGGQTFNTDGADIEVRGICRSLTIAVTGTSGTTPTAQFVGITGPITLSGTSAAGMTCNLFGVSSSLSGSITNCTTTDSTTSRINYNGGNYALNTTGSGNIGIDWANVENQGTSVNLSATTINLVNTVTTLTNAVTLADGAHGGSSAVLTLKQLVINNSAGTAVDIDGTTGGVAIDSSDVGSYAIWATGGAAGGGVRYEGGFGMEIVGSGGAAVEIVAASAGTHGLYISGGTGDGNAIQLNPFGTGKAINFLTGIMTGDITGTLSNVTLVATTTTNTDMRGTDGANTTVPDAAGTAASLHSTTDGLIVALPTATQNVDEWELQSQADPTGFHVNTMEINSASIPAVRLALSAASIVTGAAEAGTLSTTQMSTDLTEATDGHYNGRILIWTSGVLKDQATDTTDYVGVDGVLTFTATTEAPSAGDTFIIV